MRRAIGAAENAGLTPHSTSPYDGMVRKAPTCEPSARVVVLAVGAALLVGCPVAGFRARRTTPPVVVLSPRSEIWIATDLTDPVAERTASRLAVALSDLAPSRTVRPGVPPEADVVVVSLAVHRSSSTRSEMVQQPMWTCDPTGACWVGYLPRVLDIPVVRVLARLEIHDASGHVWLRPRVLDLEEAGEEPMTAELRLIGRLVRQIDALFRWQTEEVRLEVEGLDVPARDVLARALEEPGPEHCAALEQLAAQANADAERARRLFAAGQCWHAVGIETDDAVSLRRAERLLLAAVRARPRERYARALRAVRELLAGLAPSPSFLEPSPSFPEPPPSYR
ncbi:MAG: hypothetical protein OHK0013_37360 [Sandaracinaceae bacterium]